MRRLVFTCVALLAVAGPAAAAVLRPSAGEGTLVVQNADNGDGIAPSARAVITLVIHGFVIGQVAEQGRIAIFDLDQTDQSAPEVTGAVSHEDVLRTVRTANGLQTQTGTQWTGANFRFRAVDGTYRVVIWGSGVYLFASGSQGRVWFTGQTDAPLGDGKYSLNGGDWHSLPLAGTREIGPPSTAAPTSAG
jgi:hypothetical protein